MFLGSSGCRATAAPYRSQPRVTLLACIFKRLNPIGSDAHNAAERHCFNRCRPQDRISFRLSRRTAIISDMICWHIAHVVLGAMRLRLSRGAERPAPRTPSGGRTPAAFFFRGRSLPLPRTPSASVFHSSVALRRVRRLGARLGVIFRVAIRR